MQRRGGPAASSAYGVQGRVVDQHGKGAPDLWVEAWEKDFLWVEPVGGCHTDGDGRFEFTLGRDTFLGLPITLTASPEVFFCVFDAERDELLCKDVYCSLQPGDNPIGDILVTLSEGEQEGSMGKILGRLIYRVDGDTAQPAKDEPIVGVKVDLLDPNNKNAVINSTSTVAGGLFTLERVADDERLLALPKVIPVDGKQPHLQLRNLDFALIPITLQGAEEISVGDLLYEARRGEVGGTVFVDPKGDGTGRLEDGRRLRGVRVELCDTRDRVVADTLTDAVGGYLFSKVEPGVYKVRSEATLHAARHGAGQGTLRRIETSPFHVGTGRGAPQEIRYGADSGAVHGILFIDKNRSGRRFNAEPPLTAATVEVVLVGVNGQSVRQVSTSIGEYDFTAVAPGLYTLRFQASLPADPQNLREELSLTTPGSVAILVQAEETTEAPPTGYGPDVHEIRGEACFDDGTQIIGLLVILEDATGHEVARTTTDSEGNYVFPNQRGDFIVRFPDRPADGQLLTRKTIPVHGASVAHVPKAVYRKTAEDGAATLVTPTTGGVQESISDIAAYMPTGQELGPSARMGGGAALGQPGALKQSVQSALMEVLGRKLRTNDPKSFLASLNRAFSPDRVVNENTIYKWTPRTYAVQTELGGSLTGAQASLYHRAKTAIDDALPMLDRLYPLDPAADLQEVEAARAIVRTEFTELVEELGLEGGPRVRRVDDLFRVLLLQLDRIEEIFGLDSGRVNTVEEEQNQTDFLVIRNYAQSLADEWNGPNGSVNFTGDGARFLGTQLVLLSRALSVVAESVDETYRMMDSVFLGPAERQTVRIQFPPTIQIGDKPEPILGVIRGRPVPAPPMLVEELLRWVAQFAQGEAPSLIQEGGRQGVRTIQPTANRLFRLVLGASRVTPTQVTHVGFGRDRVRRALRELALQLQQVDELARQLVPKEEQINFES